MTSASDLPGDPEGTGRGRLRGRQPPFATRALLGREQAGDEAAQEVGGRRGAYAEDEGYGPPDPYGPAAGYGPPDFSGRPEDDHGRAQEGYYEASGPEYEPADDGYGPAGGGYEPADDGYGPAGGGYEPADDGYGPAGGDYAAPGSVYGPPGGYPEAGPARVSAADAAGGLAPDFLLPGRRRTPAPGWRRVLFEVSGGLMRVPSSAAEVARGDLVRRARTPVARGHHRVAVLSLKGGVGKTTTTVGLGCTLASLRGDRVVAVDANPDRGTLSDKVGLETSATVRDLLNERGQITRYADVRGFTSQSASRLEVLASDRDPEVSVAFSDDDYCQVCRVLERFYSVCLTDCGTGLLHSAMAGVLRLADQVVLVATPSVDGARSASATLDWLAAHSRGDLVSGAVTVLSAVRSRRRSAVDVDRMEEHFAARCRAVVRIPYDTHLEEGAEVELDQLSKATAEAYLDLAAVIGDGFAASGPCGGS